MKGVKRRTLKELFSGDFLGQEVVVKGWLRSVRNNKHFAFLVLNDGTTQGTLQIVADSVLDNYEKITSLLAGSSVGILGKVVESQGKNQSIELQAQHIEIYGEVDSTYPLQKKRTSLEFLREKAHLRVRTNTFGAVFRVRHALAFATHKFFNDRGFKYLHTPIITGSDCEGAGEMFQVTTLDMEQLPRDDKGRVDFSRDYFGKATNLTVSGQLEAECFAMGLGAVYTFGPTFRAENSNTTRHLAEFWMVEPEVAFADLDDDAQLASDYLKYLIDYALTTCSEEMKFFEQFYQKGLIDSLTQVRDSEFIKITYTEAINILEQSNKKFDFTPKWGADLQTEHERFLTEEHFQGPVIVTDYPKEIKAFYMKQNDDGKTVRAMDVLVPGVGEIIGGSQREDSYDKLVARIKELGQKVEDYWWYLDLRKYGSVPHSGFGLGFERAVMYITGMSNVRDVIAFPRTPKNAEF